MPTCASASPLTTMVCTPSTKSSARSVGTGTGFQRSGSGGVTTPIAAPVFQVACGMASCAMPATATPGWRRYIQVRRLAARGAVKAVPESSSA